jgi:citrate lyase beta subunit
LPRESACRELTAAATIAAMGALLRRSLLYMPGSSEKMIRKAAGRGADVVILDLEDGVHPDAKDQAREQVARLIPEVDFGGTEVFVRANPLSSPWGARDIESIAGISPDGVVLPKVSDPEEVASVDATLGKAIPLFLMIETAAGVLNVASLARCSPRVAGLVFGAADYRESLRAPPHPDELELFFARSQVVHAARAAGPAEVLAFDTPWFEYLDTQGLSRSARRARQLGFDGKTAIHPAQIATINRVFSPTPSELARAIKVVAAMEEALESGSSLATLDGELIEALHLREARRTLERAKALGLLPEA